MKSWSVGAVCVAAALCLAQPAAASPQEELARLAAPWKRLANSIIGSSAPARRELRGRPAAAAARKLQLTEEELLEKEAELEAEAIEESKIKWGYVIGILALGATFIGGYILESNEVTRLPEAGVGILIGAGVAYSAILGGNEVISSHEKFDFEFFMTWLLPPIIFEAGYNMNVPAFLANIGPTMFFAFVGTFASTFVVGGMVWYAGQAGLCYPLEMLAALVFGSLISATDPVTVLAVFQKIGVKVDLFSMVFGESVLNDAVAIVLSRTLLGFNKPGVEVDSDSIMAAVASFCTIFGGSLLIGAFYGILSALVFKKLDMRHHAELIFMQSSLSFAFPWAAYFTSEALELSGIVTILFCGMIMAVYTRYNFSEEARVLTAQGYKCVAQVAETYVFVYLGMAVFTFPIFEDTTFRLCAYALLACFVGRLHIYIGSWMTNCFRSEGDVPPPISGIYMFVMWFSGLRGGVAFALASVSFANMDFPTNCGGITDEALKAVNPYCNSKEDMSDSLAILQTTLLIAAFTIFVFGGAITEVAVAGGVLTPKGEVDDTPMPTGGVFAFKDCLTLAPDTHHAKMESSARFEAAVLHAAAPAQETPRPMVVPSPAPAGPGPTSAEIKAKLAANPDSGMGHLAGLLSDTEDKMDELRDVFRGYSTDQLKKMLDEAGGDVQLAIKQGQSKGF